MTIRDLQQKVAEDWEFNSKNKPTDKQQLLYVIEEFGEVAEAIRKSEGMKDRIASTDLGSEFADLVVSIVTLANNYNIDLESEIDKFWKRLQKRR